MKTKADAERDAMMNVAKHPFEKGLLEHVSKEMEVLETMMLQTR